MPRYFFHVSHRHFSEDADGTELPDAQSAWHEAVRACGEMIKDIDGALEFGPEWRMDVTDEQGRKLFAIHLTAEAFHQKR